MKNLHIRTFYFYFVFIQAYSKKNLLMYGLLSLIIFIYLFQRMKNINKFANDSFINK